MARPRVWQTWTVDDGGQKNVVVDPACGSCTVGQVVVCWECGQLSDQTLDDCCFAVTRSWAQGTVGIPCLDRCRGGTCLQGGKSRTLLINYSRYRTRFEDSLSEDISNAQKLNSRLYMKTNYILYKAIREVFIKKWKFLMAFDGCQWEIKLYLFSRDTLFSVKNYPVFWPKIPPNLRKLRYFPVDYYPSLNAPIS